MLVNPDILLTGSTSSGTLSKNTPALAHGELKQLVVTPSTTTTEYTVSLTDRNSVVIFQESFIGALLRETTIPVAGIVTVDISSATADELFTILLKTREG